MRQLCYQMSITNSNGCGSYMNSLWIEDKFAYEKKHHVCGYDVHLISILCLGFVNWTTELVVAMWWKKDKKISNI